MKYLLKHFSGLSEPDRKAVQGFVGFIETVNEGQDLTRHFAVMAFGSSVAPASDKEPGDIDLKILNPGRTHYERDKLVELVRQKIREHLVGRSSFSEAGQTYRLGGNLRWESGQYNSDPGGIKGGYAVPNQDPSFQIFPEIGKPLHVSISGADRLPSLEHILAEKRGDKPFSLLTSII